ncbi:sensor histidine kinase [Novosphingobium sp. 1949]|uniref:histidine kinase n=1 Tax=Novosphingobium organovorum TaxID=2930092 RepID=A0ABT0BBQ0_9SPHN|nr:sensor histidine kinase [Novosphingobium organovorum]MCJ2182487.1 sensor histidine kinase [Novosphingobium organovorum]
MHFDDRLSTVLRHSAASGTLARIQFRQLVDILAQAPADHVSPLCEQGYARLEELGTAIRPSVQADLIRQSLVRLTNPRLLLHLAETDARVASTALAKTRLAESQWLALIPRLPVHARGILRHRRDLPPRVNDLLDRLGIQDRALPPAILPPAPDSADPDAGMASPTPAPPAASAAASVAPSAPSQDRREPAEALRARRASCNAAPSNAAEVEELVLTSLLGEAMPPASELGLAPLRAAAGPVSSTVSGTVSTSTPAAPPASHTAAPARRAPPPAPPPPVGEPPAAPFAPAVPTSLREWARLRASGTITPAPEGFAPVHRSDPGIGAIVRRIEEFRRTRQKPAMPEPANDSPRLPLGDALPDTQRGPSVFDFATDAEGRVTWADGAHAPALTGFSLPAHEIESDAIAAALRARLPIRAGRIALVGTSAVSGEWQVDAAACFERTTGQFTGYCGRLRRPAPMPRAATAASLNAEADRMRQVLHELRTPANAIQVAAEIIQQQLYGPAPHEYRALAASIAGDCAHILAGFEELDRLVKLETGALTLEPGASNLAQVTCRTMERLSGWTAPRRSGFIPAPGLDTADLPLALDHDETERLVWRLLAALAGASASDERLALDWHDTGASAVLELALPHMLAERADEELFSIGTNLRNQALTAGVFGVGFTLRLAAAEAAAAGGGLERIANRLTLTLPLSRPPRDTAASARQSHRS